MRLFGVLLLCSLALPLYAYSPLSAEPAELYEAIPVEGDTYIERSYLGDLEGAPDLYEFTTDVAIDIKIALAQKVGNTAVPFGLIMVRQNDGDGGVTEVARQNQSLDTWKQERSFSLGMSFLKSDVIEKNITPGTYRLEVSTPDNTGAYLLTIGEEPGDGGFFKTYLDISKTHYHFGLPPAAWILSLWVLIPLGMSLMGYSWYQYRRYKQDLHDYTS